MKKEQVNLAIVDDHQIVIDGLKSLLRAHPHFRVVLETTDPLKAVNSPLLDEVDILLTDIMMPGLSGIELSRQVKRSFPSIRILALSMNGQGDQVNQMVNDSDISGYVLKNIGQQELLEALEKIAGGGVYFSDEVLAEMVRDGEKKPEVQDNQLTQREIEIVRLIEKELNNKQIADMLFISERTVETHRKNIFRKTRTNSVIGLIKYAYEQKLIS